MSHKPGSSQYDQIELEEQNGEAARTETRSRQSSYSDERSRPDVSFTRLGNHDPTSIYRLDDRRRAALSEIDDVAFRWVSIASFVGAPDLILV